MFHRHQSHHSKHRETAPIFPDALVFTGPLFKMAFLIFRQLSFLLDPTDPKWPPSSRTSPFSSPASSCIPLAPHSGSQSWTRRRHKSQNGLPSPIPSSTKMSRSTRGIGFLSCLRPGLRLDPLLDCGTFHISFHSTILGH